MQVDLQQLQLSQLDTLYPDMNMDMSVRQWVLDSVKQADIADSSLLFNGVINAKNKVAYDNVFI